MSFHALAVSDNSLKEKFICLICFVFVVIVVFQQILLSLPCGKKFWRVLIFRIFQKRDAYTVALFENMYFYCTYLTQNKKYIYYQFWVLSTFWKSEKLITSKKNQSVLIGKKLFPQNTTNNQSPEAYLDSWPPRGLTGLRCSRRLTHNIQLICYSSKGIFNVVQLVVAHIDLGVM